MWRKQILYYLKEKDLPSELNTLEKCFQKVISLAEALKNGKGDQHPLVTLDIGSFGSNSFKSVVEDETTYNMSRNALTTLYDNTWTMEEWEESFTRATGKSINRAYIGALQRILASRADCLILMGGGSFQALAVRDYYNYHKELREKCVHFVCTRRAFKQSP